MTNTLQDIEPKLLWNYFDAIRKIPRSSGKETEIRNYLLKEASRLSLKAKQDKTGNIVITSPATKGYENSKITVLQGHMDMVCEKKTSVIHNFEKNPIEIEIKDDYVMAKGTTLGADNGIGIAAALAVISDTSAVHGPLELLFTVEEETGLTGAFNLDTSMLTGRRMLNLDSEEDGTIYIGCAGGADDTITVPINRTASSHDAWPYVISVSRLKGGHSGLNIIENRANAIKLLARIFMYVRKIDFDLEVAIISGGSKRNAIPREACALLRVKDLAPLKTAIEKCSSAFQSEYGSIDPDIDISLQPRTAGIDEMVFDLPSTERILNLLTILPNGVISMNRAIKGLVETSTNLAIVNTFDEHVTIQINSRSSNAYALENLREQIHTIARISGGKPERGGSYPGWQPDINSALLNISCGVYRQLYGKSPLVTAIHAGLECGIIGEKFSGMQMISFGPEIKGAHSPEEQVHIPSVNRFYQYLKALLKTLAEM